MSVEAAWHGPVCVRGIVCYAVFISVLPLSEIMLRTYWRVMPWWTTYWNDSQWWEWKRRRVAHTFTCAWPGRHEDIGSEAKKKCIARLTEIAFNLFSIFTVYNICNVIYLYVYIDILYIYSIYSQFLFIYFCNSSIAFSFVTPIENTLQQLLSLSTVGVWDNHNKNKSEHTQVLDCLTECLQCSCKESFIDVWAAASFRAVLSTIRLMERRGEEMKGAARPEWAIICKFCFVFLPCNPTLRTLHCLSLWVQQRQGGCVCAYACMCV